MNLRDTTRDIIRLVEERTGYPVEVIDDPSLSVTAVVHMASRRTVPAHLLRYNPVIGQLPDYPICFQCGFILRLFDNPPEKRFEVANTPDGEEMVEKMVAARLGNMGIDRRHLAPVAQQMYHGMIVHLRSIPVGLRVSAWLADEYPELHKLQRNQVMAEAQENAASFDPQIRAITPDIIFRASAAINAAFALFWSQRYKKPSLIQPYIQAGYRKDGADLLDIYNEIPKDASHDQELIDRWAQALDLSKWYQWIPYQPPA